MPKGLVMTLRRLAIALFASLLASTAQATCWQAAGSRYHIDPLLLYAIAKVESGLNPGARNLNRDGSYDIGLMQINSRHLPRLAAYGIDEHSLQSQPCTSVMVGAWILAEFIRQSGYGWHAVGAYNAGTRPQGDARRARYAEAVWRYYGQLSLARQQRAVPTP